jgi:Cytochrome bd terminal oxidase subunit I
VNVLLSRWQFGVTITYHFLFVPLTIGLGLLVAVMQVLAYRRRDQTWERLTRFFGTLFLINFAMGVVTGIVQEFQFGIRVTRTLLPLPWSAAWTWNSQPAGRPRWPARAARARPRWSARCCGSLISPRAR